MKQSNETAKQWLKAAIAVLLLADIDLSMAS